ncbi:MAG: HEAT repeat domain-containing protein [Chlamydiales bacterium]|nr:HEAT repeat domain-containing protein [Chlamydiales bacterium]
MRALLSVVCFAIPCLLIAYDPDLGTPEEAGRRVSAHLLLRDPYSAVEEAKRGKLLFPESKMLQISLIRALCEKGDEIDAIEEWKRATTQFGMKPDERFMLEMLAWGVLNKGDTSSQPMVKFSSLLGACATRDAKAVPLLLKELRSTNSWLRAMTVRLAAAFGDAPLRDELLRMLKEEKVWYVRLEVIKAVGQLNIAAAQELLKELIANPRTLIEERGYAMLALVNMYEKVEKADLDQLLRSKRAGLRELACQIIAHLELHERIEDLFPLLNDTSFEVRLAALNCLGLLDLRGSPKPILEIITPSLNDSTPQVAITAAWVALVNGEKVGEERLRAWIQERDPQMRRLASAAVAFSGVQGLGIAKDLIRQSSDPYVQVNLAMGLIGLRQETKQACDVLYSLFAKEQKELWMWDNHLNPLFRTLSPSRVSHIEHIPHYPMVVDQLVKLDLLSVLSIMRYPKAVDAVKGFLKNQTWGVSGAAAATLIEEGSDECLTLVEALLEDSDPKIRMQAAFIMAILGGESSAIKVLQEIYPRMNREMKLYILEAIGHVGDRSSIPFLLEILKEPFQVQRLVAASALIQCLYH